MDILSLPPDLWIQIAMELSLPDILSLCASNSNFEERVCKSSNFWRRKIVRDFPGIKQLPKNDDNRKFYTHIRRSLDENPEALPYILKPTTPNEYIVLDQAAKRGRYVLNNICGANSTYGNACKQDATWRNMLNIFYPYLKGDFNIHKTKYYPNLTWKQYYLTVVSSPELLISGF